MRRLHGKRNGQKRCEAVTRAHCRCSRKAALDGLCTTHYLLQQQGSKVRRCENDALCNVLKVTRDVCKIRFEADVDRLYDHSLNGFVTIDGDEMSINLDASGRVIGIDFATKDGKKKKPCGA